MPSLSQPSADLYRRADRLLVLLPWSPGDVLMQRPMLSALRRAAPATEILALGAEPALGLLDDGRLAERSATYQSFGINHELQQPTAAVDEALRTWLDRAGHADDILTCIGTPPAAHHALLHAGRTPVEPDLNLAAQAHARGSSVQEAVIEGTSAGWGLPVDAQSLMRLDPPEWARRAADEFFEHHNIADWLPAAICPAPISGSAAPWPAERFAEIADSLIASTRAPLLMLSTTGSSAEDVRATMERAGEVIALEQQHILILAAILQRSRVLVCNDGDLLNLAATVGTPVVGIANIPASNRPRYPWADAISADADVEQAWGALRALIPLTASPTGVHPTHSAVAGAGTSRTPRPAGGADETER